MDRSIDLSTVLSSERSRDRSMVRSMVLSKVLSRVLSMVLAEVVPRIWSSRLLIFDRGAREVRISLWSRKRRMSSISKSSGSCTTTRGRPFSSPMGRIKYFAHQVVGDQIDRIGGDRCLVQLDIVHAMLCGQCLENVPLGADFEIDQRFANAHSLLFAVLQARLLTSLGWAKPHSISSSPSFFC